MPDGRVEDHRASVFALFCDSGFATGSRGALWVAPRLLRTAVGHLRTLVLRHQRSAAERTANMTHALSRLLPKHLESRLARCGADQLVRNGAPGFEFATAMHAVEKAEILEKRKVIESITQSIREANSDYEDYSGGNWLSDYGVEGFLVAHIARNLIPLLRESNPNALLTLEETFGAIFHHASGSGTPGPVPAILAPNSRADIVLWESRETVSGVIEVKRKWTTQYCLRDLRRLSRLIERCGTKKGALEVRLLCLFHCESA